MRHAIALVIAVPLALLAPAAGAFQFSEGHRLDLNQTLLVNSNQITGDDRGSSFLTPGVFFTHDLEMVYNRSKGDRTFEAGMTGRTSDDDRIQVKRHLLKTAYLRYDDGKNAVNGGDILASLAPYTLNASLKGLRYARRTDTFEASVLVGLDKPEWDDLWNHTNRENIDRRVYGARLAKSFANEAAFGTSFAWSKDTHARQGVDVADTTTPVEDQRVAGVDWSLPALWNLKLSGESAFSRTDHDNPTPYVDPDGIIDPTTADYSKSGYAHKVKADFAFKRFNTRNEFERVSPRFATNMGASSPDLIRVNTENTLDLVGPWKWLVFNYAWYHDNLDRDPARARTVTRVPETGLRYEAPDWRASFSLEAKVRHRESIASDTGLRSRTRSVIGSLNDRLGPLSLNVDYEFQHEDVSDASLSARHHILGIGGGGSFVLAKEWKLSPALRWNLQRDRDNLTSLTDQTGGITANLNLDAPWGLSLATGFSRNHTMPAASATGSDRRTVHATLGWNIRKDENHRVELRYRKNDNRFEQPGLGFKETVVGLAISNKF